MITRLDIRTMIGKIAEVLDDDEVAHREEDKLYELVLKVIATGDTDDARGLAMEALKSKNISFSRWYA